MNFENKNFNNLRNRDKAIILRTNFRVWKVNSLETAGYFIIFQGFEEGNKLKNISGNGLRLYIYLGLHANNYEGIVWHSNNTIAKYFEKSERTIRGWMKELEDLNLIKRMRLKYDGNAYTYLQPYISKYSNSDNDNDNDNEGILYLNDFSELCFQNKFKSVVLIDDEYDISIFMNDIGFVRGNLLKEPTKNNIDYDYYIFKDNNKTNLKLDYTKGSDLIFKAIIHNEFDKEILIRKRMLDENFKTTFETGLIKWINTSNATLMIKATFLLELRMLSNGEKNYNSKEGEKIIMNSLIMSFENQFSLSERKSLIKIITSSEDEFKEFAKSISHFMAEDEVLKILKQAAEKKLVGLR